MYKRNERNEFPDLIDKKGIEASGFYGLVGWRCQDNIKVMGFCWIERV